MKFRGFESLCGFELNVRPIRNQYDSPYSLYMLSLVPGKFEGKCEGKKIQRKTRRKEKVKENKKIY